MAESRKKVLGKNIKSGLLEENGRRRPAVLWIRFQNFELVG
jgi:hypothetical protein